MSDQHFPTENEGAKPGGNTGSVHGEAPVAGFPPLLF